MKKAVQDKKEEIVTLGWVVPKSLAPTIRKMVNKYIFENDPMYKPVFEYMRNNPDKTLAQMVYKLRQLGLRRSEAGLKKIAQACNLDYAK